MKWRVRPASHDKNDKCYLRKERSGSRSTSSIVGSTSLRMGETSDQNLMLSFVLILLHVALMAIAAAVVFMKGKNGKAKAKEPTKRKAHTPGTSPEFCLSLIGV